MARVLLVEDDAGVREIVQRVLVSLGHEVVAFDDAGLALAWLASEHADAVITDLVMPTPGAQLIRAVREHDPSVPVIVMSGYLTEHDLGELEELGATRFVEKPLRVPELVSLLELYLGPDQALI